jgi:hypothetical protein
MLAAAASGFGGGACVGLVGWGGGQFIIPSLTGVAGLTQLAASGSSILSLTGAAVMSAATFAASGSADVQTAALIGVPSMGGARLGVLVARRLPPDVHALCFNGLSTLMLPAHLLIQGARQRQRDRRDAEEERHSPPLPTGIYGPLLPTSMAGSPLPINIASSSLPTGTASSPVPAGIASSSLPTGISSSPPLAMHTAFGVFAGFLSAIMGVGGGPLVMSYLTLATPLEHHLVQGTAACAVAPGMCAASLSHAVAGTVPLGVASLVTAGAALGAVGGTRAALWLSEEQLRTVYVASLVLLGGRAFGAALSNLASITRRWRGRQ